MAAFYRVRVLADVERRSSVRSPRFRARFGARVATIRRAGVSGSGRRQVRIAGLEAQRPRRMRVQHEHTGGIEAGGRRGRRPGERRQRDERAHGTEMGAGQH